MRFDSLDEGFKCSSYLTETLLDPQLGHAYESNKTAFNKTFNVEEDMWTWYETPNNRLRLARFGAGMSGVKNMSSPDAILAGYAWGELPEGSLVVDVGGGVGSQTLLLALHHPHLRFIVQDRESVVGDAVEVREFNLPTSSNIWYVPRADNILDRSTGIRTCRVHSNLIA